MFAQLAIATGMVLLTVVIHGIGLLALVRLLHLEQLEEDDLQLSPVSVKGLSFTFALVLGADRRDGAPLGRKARSGARPAHPCCEIASIVSPLSWSPAAATTSASAATPTMASPSVT